MAKSCNRLPGSIRYPTVAFVLMVIVITGLTGCGKKRTPLPPELRPQATVAGLAGVRTWVFEHSPEFEKDLIHSVQQELSYSTRGHNDATGHFNLLALSGGGANGAFGAGILYGWSAAGTRPTFKLVTGISTGALIAPFAFLGSEYDPALKEVFTSVATKDIMRVRPFIVMRGGLDSLADTTPLQELLEEYITDDVIRDVARAHQTGRRLYIGTTDLDASRLVIWNMGVIAAADRPEAFDLFRSIMLASASIPILFPPVYIPVEVGGAAYEEMHVDGGVATQVFLYLDILNIDDVVEEAGLLSMGPGRIYIIQNLKSLPPFEPVKPSLVDISKKTVSGLLTNQSIGDLYRIYTNARKEGIKFKLVYIPSDFELESSQMFDPVVMEKLFERGYQMALAGDPWLDAPPGYRD